LRYNNSFGDTNAIQTISVYKVNELLKGDSAYQTNKVVSYSEKLGSSSFAPSTLNDSLFLFRQNINNQLRIKINNQFAAKLLTFDTSNFSPLNNDSAFRAYLNGFAGGTGTAGQGSNGGAGSTSTNFGGGGGGQAAAGSGGASSTGVGGIGILSTITTAFAGTANTSTSTSICRNISSGKCCFNYTC
jgi:hypothetical protein